ncbi:MAG: hypothetical protein GXY76_03540 [Chloroflexi bacterium]|nr:hypothetical protein [Chloroflexota bacterium]
MPNEFGFDPVAVTKGPKHHFFGYYGICPWDITGRYMLCLESTFHERPPTAQDKAVVGLVETATGRFEPLAETYAWNLQQGTMLHWLPTAPDRQIVFNDRQGDRFVSVVLDIHTGKRRVLPRPVSGLSHDGRWAVSLNYARLASLRPVVGYAGLPDLFADKLHPAEDGIYLMDLETGDAQMLVSYQEGYEYLRHIPEVEDHKIWYNHTIFNRDDSRLSFVIRWNEPGIEIKRTIFVSCSAKGGDLRTISELGASHFDWRSRNELFGWYTTPEGPGYYLYNDDTREHRRIGKEYLTRDGHCSFTRDGRWVLTDTGPDEQRLQTLKLWNWAEERQVILGKFYSAPQFKGQVRCDMHPRWNRDDTMVAFDSVHEGARQVYVVDVSKVVNG